MNLFEEAKKKSTKSTAKKSGIEVPMPNHESDILKMDEIDKKLAELQAERDELRDKVTESAKKEFFKLYDKTQQFPGTLRIVAKSAEAQFIVPDKYKTIDEDRAKELAKKYSKEIVTEDTEYYFDKKMLKKHMNTISELITQTDKIDDHDKAELIKSKVKHTVAKGAIKNLKNPTFGTHKVSAEKVFEDIQPSVQLKIVRADDE